MEGNRKGKTLQQSHTSSRDNDQAWQSTAMAAHVDSLRRTIHAFQNPDLRPWEIEEKNIHELDPILALLDEVESDWRMGNEGYALDTLCRAHVHYGWLVGGKNPKEVRSELARVAAIAKLARDPKQAAKSCAYDLWLERQKGRQPRLRTNEAFAAECMRRWPILTSAKVILGWCTKWNKSAKAHKP